MPAVIVLGEESPAQRKKRRVGRPKAEEPETSTTALLLCTTSWRGSHYTKGQTETRKGGINKYRSPSYNLAFTFSQGGGSGDLYDYQLGNIKTFTAAVYPKVPVARRPSVGDWAALVVPASVLVLIVNTLLAQMEARCLTQSFNWIVIWPPEKHHVSGRQ